MSRLALVTWRLPHADLVRIERAREGLQALEDREDVFTFATCQRCLACTVDEEPRRAIDEVVETVGLSGGERHADLDALAHLARVAASLDALVPGEDQVPAQFREALDEQAENLDSGLHEELQRARSIARQARGEGGLAGHEGRSIVALAQPLLPEEGELAVLGTGSIAREVVDELGDDRGLHVVSQDRKRARELAASDTRAWEREAFFEEAPSLAGLVLCTRAPDEPVLDEDRADPLVRARCEDTLQVVDLGVPRNAEPGLARREGLRVSTVEDLARLAGSAIDPDPRVERARRALEEALERERRRRREDSLDERVVALREHLAEELEALTEDIEGPPEDQLEAWVDRAHGRLAHASQEHLEAAVRGEDPP